MLKTVRQKSPDSLLFQFYFFNVDPFSIHCALAKDAVKNYKNE